MSSGKGGRSAALTLLVFAVIVFVAGFGQFRLTPYVEWAFGHAFSGVSLTPKPTNVQPRRLPPPPPAPKPIPPPQPVVRRQQLAAIPRAETVASPTAPAPSVTTVPRVAVEETPGVEPPSAPPALVPRAEDVSVSAEPLAIYSALDTDVTAPQAVRADTNLPRLAVGTDEIVTITVTINQKGEVVSATMQSESQTIADAMLHAMALQAIRSWRFRPAMKAGMPVPYRQQLVFRGSGRGVKAEATARPDFPDLGDPARK